MVARRAKADPNLNYVKQKPLVYLAPDRNYVEYPFEDFGFRRITRIEKSVALGIIDESRFKPTGDTIKVTRLAQGTIVDMMNKGAIRTNHPGLWVAKHDRFYWLAEEPDWRCYECGAQVKHQHVGAQIGPEGE
jgi:hypothetical protein